MKESRSEKKENNTVQKWEYYKALGMKNANELGSQGWEGFATSGDIVYFRRPVGN